MHPFIIIANIAVLVLIGIAALAFRALGWEFALGGMFGAFLTHVTVRLHYGRWL